MSPLNATRLLQSALIASSFTLPACSGDSVKLGADIFLTAPLGASAAEATAQLQATLGLEDCSKRDGDLDACVFTPQTPAQGAWARAGANGNLGALSWLTGGCLTRTGPGSAVVSADLPCWSGSLSGYPSTYDFEAGEDDETITSTLETWAWPTTSFTISGTGESTKATVTWSGWPSETGTVTIQNEAGEEIWMSYNEHLVPSAENVIEVPSTVFTEPGHYEAHLVIYQPGNNSGTDALTISWLDFAAPIDVGP